MSTPEPRPEPARAPDREQWDLRDQRATATERAAALVGPLSNVAIERSADGASVRVDHYAGDGTTRLNTRSGLSDEQAVTHAMCWRRLTNRGEINELCAIGAAAEMLMKSDRAARVGEIDFSGVLASVDAQGLGRQIVALMLVDREGGLSSGWPRKFSDSLAEAFEQAIADAVGVLRDAGVQPALDTRFAQLTWADGQPVKTTLAKVPDNVADFARVLLSTVNSGVALKWMRLGATQIAASGLRPSPEVILKLEQAVARNVAAAKAGQTHRVVINLADATAQGVMRFAALR